MDNTLDIFFTDFFKNNCNCTKKECVVLPDIPIVTEYVNIPEMCNIITYPPSETTTVNYTRSLRPVLTEYNLTSKSIDLYKYLLKHQILKLKGSSVYLYNGSLLTWVNIQNLQPRHASRLQSNPIFKHILQYFYKTDDFYSPTIKFTNAIKLLLWYFRKSVVDNIIKDTIVNFKLNVLVISVGSTNLSSDYDVTLYSPNTHHIVFCIRVFTSTIKELFNIDSSILFDTNLYGSAFIQFTTESARAPSSPTKVPSDFIDKSDKSLFQQPFHTPTKCRGKTFYYVTNDGSFEDSQHIWALIKVLYQLDTSNIPDKCADKSSLESSSIFNTFEGLFGENVYYKKALDTYLFLKQYKVNLPYSVVVSKLEEYVDISPELYVSFVSLVNFFGHETYFTRGTFLDVVVNQQMCGEDSVDIKNSGYLDSFIENMVDFIHTYKGKYLERANKAFRRLTGVESLVSEFESVISTARLCIDTSCNKDYLGQELITFMIKVMQLFFKEKPNLGVFDEIKSSLSDMKDADLILCLPSLKIPGRLKKIDESKSLHNSPRSSITN